MNTTKQIQIMVGLVFLLVAGLIAYTIWEPSRVDDAEERQVGDQLERGATLFANTCAVCHGLTGEGFVGPALNRPENRPSDPLELKALQDKLRNTITCGRVGTFMPAWAKEQGGPLNGDQIRNLVILITKGDEHGWELAKEHAEEVDIKPARPTADQINQGACGQVLRATPTPSGSPGAGPAVEAKTSWDVKMGDNFFDPKQIAVPVGQQARIALKNEGSAIHNMRIAGPDGRYDTSDDAASQPESIRAGQSGALTVTFQQAGTFNFRCDFHPTDMTGTITAQ